MVASCKIGDVMGLFCRRLKHNGTGLFYKGNKGLIKRGIPVTGGAVGRLSGEWHCNIR